jgi:hypothetical protein
MHIYKKQKIKKWIYPAIWFIQKIYIILKAYCTPPSFRRAAFCKSAHFNRETISLIVKECATVTLNNIIYVPYYIRSEIQQHIFFLQHTFVVMLVKLTLNNEIVLTLEEKSYFMAPPLYPETPLIPVKSQYLNS